MQREPAYENTASTTRIVVVVLRPL